MSIASFVALLATQMYPQGDVRDPLGVWGFRTAVTGDATGGEIKVIVQTPEGQAAAYVYTVYDLLISQTSGAGGLSEAKVRILSNWPNIDNQAGVQAYSTGLGFLVQQASGGISQPSALPRGGLISRNQRKILLFDPRQSPDPIDIVEMAVGNFDTRQMSFEGYGYYYDRSVMQAPGGPRHP